MTQVMTPEKEQLDTVKPFPAWASVLVILLCLAGGGWMVHWYIMTDTTTKEASIVDEHPRAGVGLPRARVGNGRAIARNAPPPPQPAISQTDQNNWQVHVPEATMFISQPAGSPPTITAINYSNADFVPQEVKNRLAFARRITQDTAMSTALKVTPDQLTELKKYTPRLHMITEPGDDDQMKSLWTEYQTGNDKAGATAKLVQALSALAHKSLDRTRQTAADRAGKIKDVLTDEQWKQFDAMGH